MDATQCKRIGRTLGDGSYIEAEITIRDGDARGLSDGFSVTGSLWEPRPNAGGRARCRMGRETDLGGMIHDQVLAAFPALAPLVAVHLSDLDGTPMHARANGWHFYSGAAREWEERHPAPYNNREGLSDHERAARALNIPPEDLPDDLEDQAMFESFCDGLAVRWREQADAARAAFEEIRNGEGVEEVRYP